MRACVRRVPVRAMALLGGRLGSWQRSLPYASAGCTGTCVAVTVPRLALFELLYGLILVFTFLHCPLRHPIWPLSPGPQAGVGVLAGASQGRFVNGTVVWACDLMFVPGFW